MSKIYKHLLAFSLVIFLLYNVEWIWYPNYSVPFVQNPDLCLEHLKQGDLYGGDPYCFQGPFVYVLLFIFEILFPSISTGITIVYIISLFGIGYITTQIKEKETEKKSMFLVYFLTVFLFGKVFISDFASILATILPLLGFYLLFYQENRWKYLITGIFFGLAMLSKPHNTPMIIGPVLLFYFLKKYVLFKKENKNTLSGILIFVKGQRSNIVQLLMPIIIIFLSAIFFLNHFLIYNYIIHTYNPVVQTYGSMIKELISFTYWYNGLFLLLYLGIAITALRLFFYKEFDIFSFISSISFFVSLLKFS